MPTPEMVDKWNLEKAMAFYKDRFADASDFTFVFVGSFDIPTIKPLIEKYLGSLPSIKRKETWKDIGVRTPNDVVVKRVEKGVEPKSSPQSFSADLSNTTRRIAWPFAPCLRFCSADYSRQFAKNSAAPTASTSTQLSANSQPGICDHD
jgi:hypothetical protein